jgi:nucleotide-binding universal stress UspA family protein
LFNKILVPLDGSKLAEKALPYAAEMVSKFGSHVTLLAAGAAPDTNQHDEAEDYLRKTSASLEQIVKKKTPAMKDNVTTAITGQTGFLNNAAIEILDYAQKQDMNMIIMATHGRTGITRWMLGDTANKVAQAFSCPIMLIRAKTDVPAVIRLRKILVPLDGSKEGEAVLSYVENLAEKLNPNIVLLNVVELLYHVYAYEAAVGYGGAGIVRVPYNPEEMKPFRDTAEKYMRKISGRLAEKKIETSTEVRVGAPGDEIIEAEEEIGPDLVVMSTHGHSGFGRFDHGSITDKVLHGGNAPLLLVRPQQTEKAKP